MFQGKVKLNARFKRTQIEAFVESEDARDAAEKLVAQIGETASLTIHPGTAATAARLIGTAPLGDILIVELGAALGPAMDRIKELKEAGSRVIAVGHVNDIPTYQDVLDAGAQEYLPLPLGDRQLQISKLLGSVAPDTRTKAQSRCIAVCGVSGGLGASAIAENLAVAYLDAAGSTKAKGDLQNRVALLDADLEFGSIAADLDTDLTMGLLDALLVPERVDDTFLTSTMATPLDGLYLYSASVNDPSSTSEMEANLPSLLRRCRQSFPLTVVDLPRSLLAAQPELAEELDDIIFIFGPGFSSVRNCSRLVERVSKSSNPPRFSYLMSKRRRGAGLTPAEVKQALNISDLHELPESASDLARASLKGQPVRRISKKGPYSRAITRLMNDLEEPVNLGSQSKRKGLFGGKRHNK
ncbi:Septum site-determining protein MinD (plasmid) [Sulfitobacter sp. DSM 110093]|uniref:AAA family ATPase n=1 Tax=Sulfitobacter sp. DSM 110093 TaxID=2883127 RepID=UPI001FADFE5F|nr:hypothetical protein [Sulfitobacter sp. DSM 110093]UOA33712.1 Septum site-determining protein MinD [Sulfitobacter sp. DSM 110093]UOA33973.1 Septum site-determining protein MinD [Sulfitobacter sp. DSM 110093]